MIIKFMMDGDPEIGYHSPYIFNIQPENHCCKSLNFYSNHLKLVLTTKNNAIIVVFGDFENILYCPFCGSGITIEPFNKGYTK